MEYVLNKQSADECFIAGAHRRFYPVPRRELQKKLKALPEQEKAKQAVIAGGDNNYRVWLSEHQGVVLGECLVHQFHETIFSQAPLAYIWCEMVEPDKQFYAMVVVVKGEAQCDAVGTLADIEEQLGELLVSIAEEYAIYTDQPLADQLADPMNSGFSMPELTRLICQVNLLPQSLFAELRGHSEYQFVPLKKALRRAGARSLVDLKWLGLLFLCTLAYGAYDLQKKAELARQVPQKIDHYKSFRQAMETPDPLIQLAAMTEMAHALRAINGVRLRRLSLIDDQWVAYLLLDKSTLVSQVMPQLQKQEWGNIVLSAREIRLEKSQRFEKRGEQSIMLFHPLVSSIADNASFAGFKYQYNQNKDQGHVRQVSARITYEVNSINSQYMQLMLSGLPIRLTSLTAHADKQQRLFIEFLFDVFGTLESSS